MKRTLRKTMGAIATVSLFTATIPFALATPASAYDASNPADTSNPSNPGNPFNINNPANPNSPLNLANQWRYGYGYGYGYGGANPTLVGLAFWTGRPYTYWACQLGVDFQCPASPNYAYRRSAPAPVAYDPGDSAPPVGHRHRVRHHH